MLNTINYRTNKSTKGRHNSKYFINANYFDKIDTEDKAYFLGFLYADGCVLKTEKYHDTVLTLHKKDTHIIETFNKYLNSTYKIYQYKDYARLSIYDGRICDSLIKLGCIPRKSLTLQFPTEEQVPTHLLRHFIRGYYDGDGGITLCIRNNKLIKTTIRITSTETFCKKLQKVILDELNINFTIYSTYDENNNITKVLSTTGSNQVNIFLSWIYKDSNYELRLDRKYNKYIEFLEFYKALLEKRFNILRSDGKVYNSISDAAKDINCSISYLGKHIRHGKPKTIREFTYKKIYGHNTTL